MVRVYVGWINFSIDKCTKSNYIFKELTRRKGRNDPRGRDGSQRIVILLQAVVAVIKEGMRLELWIGEDQPSSIHGRGLVHLGFLRWCTIGIQGWMLLLLAAADLRRCGGYVVTGVANAFFAPIRHGG